MDQAAATFCPRLREPALASGTGACKNHPGSADPTASGANGKGLVRDILDGFQGMVSATG
jgi:hypothetical protein